MSTDMKIQYCLSSAVFSDIIIIILIIHVITVPLVKSHSVCIFKCNLSWCMQCRMINRTSPYQQCRTMSTDMKIQYYLSSAVFSDIIIIILIIHVITVPLVKSHSVCIFKCNLSWCMQCRMINRTSPYQQCIYGLSYPENGYINKGF